MKMDRTVILVIALVIASSNGKVFLTEEGLPDPSNNVRSKDNVEPNSQHDLQTTTTPTRVNAEVTRNSLVLDLFVNKTRQSNNSIATGARNDSNNTKNIVNTGTPVILTPLIEEGRIEEARNACRVDPSLFLGVESYSGFFTVNKTYNSNIFFWYFPIENKPINETPWIIWLQGGPGASSLTGLFDEIGPFKVLPDGTLKKNPHTWLNNQSLLFIDSPIGSGYSFTDHVEGYAKDMATYSKHLYSTVRQFIQVFPELRVVPLFVAGESYAGKYVPALATQIHNHRNDPGLDINLKGMIIGNGYVDPAMISQVTRPFYYFGLLEKQQIETIEPLLKAFQEDIANNDSLAAKNKWTSLISVLLFLTHQKQAYNFLKDDLTVGRYVVFLNRPEIKRAIHVGETKFSLINITTNLQLAPDFLSSSKHLFEKLLEEYRVLAYCGQLDQMLPCVFTSENYRTWKWSAMDEFRQATRYPFIVNNRLAGYCKSGGRLTEVVVRGAGHMVPLDEPAPSLALITRWTRGLPLARRNSILEGSYIQEFVANNSAIYF